MAVAGGWGVAIHYIFKDLYFFEEKFNLFKKIKLKYLFFLNGDENFGVYLFSTKFCLHTFALYEFIIISFL